MERQKDGRMDKQTLFYRILVATARSTIRRVHENTESKTAQTPFLHMNGNTFFFPLLIGIHYMQG